MATPLKMPNEWYIEEIRQELNDKFHHDDFEVYNDAQVDLVDEGAWVTIRLWVYSPEEGDK